MTQYNFIDSPNRLSQHAEKWRQVETDKELLPLWIADMDFEPLPEIRQVIRDYAVHHVLVIPMLVTASISLLLTGKIDSMAIRLKESLFYSLKELFLPYLWLFNL